MSKKRIVIGVINLTIICIGVILLIASCGGNEEKNTIDDVIKSVTKSKYEVKSNDGIVTIIIENTNIHEGYKPILLDQAAEIFAGLSKIDEVKSPSIQWNTTLIDSYGNEEIGEVLGISFHEDTFKKVNWDNYEKLDIEQIADNYRQNESLKN